MRLKCLACDVLARPLYLNAARSPHIVDIELFPRGLHNTPAILRSTLQDRIDAAAGQGYDAILMAYGLCGQATAGLVSQDIPVVVPRAHDCITIFLGSRALYAEQFEAFPGTYWYALDYMERDDGSGASLGSGMDTNPSVYEEYVEKYGADNADYLMEVMGAWQAHYQRAAYIDMGVRRWQCGRAAGARGCQHSRVGVRACGWGHGSRAKTSLWRLGRRFPGAGTGPEIADDA